MATKIDRIASLLAQGIPPSVVSKIVGVSESYISQLRSSPDFSTHLELLTTELAEGGTTEEEETTLLKDKLLGAEHKIIDHILKRIDYMSDGHALAALSRVADRRDSLLKQEALTSAIKSVGRNGGTLRMVELTIPAISAPELQMGKNNEIVSIGGRDITPLPTATLSTLLSTTSPSSTSSTIDQVLEAL